MFYLVEVEGELFNDFHYVYDHLNFFLKKQIIFCVSQTVIQAFEISLY